VDRSRTDRAGHPAPPLARIGPATVVKRRETPGCIVDPGPAPRLDPGPVSMVIRCPVARHRGRHPDVAIALDHTPRSIIVEVGVADDVRRDIAGGDGIVLPPIALPRP